LASGRVSASGRVYPGRLGKANTAGINPAARHGEVVRLMLEEYRNKKVVVDLSSTFVCLGKLTRYDEHFLELKNADVHDLRDTETTREIYVADSVATGVKRNRKRVLIRRDQMVAISLLDDVVDE